MENLLADLRHAYRVFLKSPGFTAIAVAALALGIGANTAIFSVINVVLLKPLPYPEPDRIMEISRSFPGGSGGSSSIPKFNTWRKNDVFEAIAAYDFSGVGVSVGGTDHAEQVKAIHVTSEYFTVYGVSPTLGRTFTAQEDVPNGPNLAVVSNQFFSRRMGGDLRLVGQPMEIAGAPTIVLGVMPATFQSDPPADIFIPLQPDPNSSNQGHYLRIAGRLKPRVTLEAARAQMKIVGERFRQANPKWMDKTESVAVVPLQQAVVGDARLPLLILLGAVGFVLLIACANVANLQLARAASRQREMAIRTAVGASRLRIVRQLLTESVVLGMAGGVLGFLIGAWGVRALLTIAPGDLPLINDALHSASTVSALDWRVLCFTLAISVATGILFGLFPAAHVSRMDVNSSLKDTNSRSGTGRHQNVARGFLVVSEIALAVILLVGAALMIRTFASLSAVNPGFDPHNMLTMQASLSSGRYGSTAQVDSLVRAMTQRLESLPGVQFAACTLMLPVEGGVDLPLNIPGKPPAKGNTYNGDEQWRYVSAHYFSAFKIPLMRGRAFNEHDDGKSAPVVIINDAMAKKYWQKEDPIGHSMILGKGLGPQFEEPAREIVGIVGNVRENGLTDSNQPVMYVPQAQITDGLTQFANKVVPLSWAVRTAMEPTALTSPILHEFQAFDSRVPVAKFRTMEQVISNSTARQNFNMLLLTIFAGVALLLAAIGIYGLMSYSVEQRQQEIGIRVALGASGGAMLRMVIVRGMALAGIGLAVGLAAAYGLTRVLASLLFGVKANDPIAFSAVALTLAMVAFMAAYIPARRATKIDPIVALRYE
ncbi:MAG TPA: ABC transporter permease [Bryobacteraceae bacterium]|nr:ABC transporter permease [Bryobacteraceae bacterium]